MTASRIGAAALAFAAFASSAGAAAVCGYVPALDVRSQPSPAAADPRVLDAATGFYKMDDYNLLNVLTVTREDDHLLAKFAGQPTAVLLPASGAKFFYQGGDSYITLDTDGSGRVRSLVLHRNHLRELPLARIDAVQAANLQARLALRTDPATGAPRSRDALYHLIDGLKSGRPDYKAMGIELEISTHRQHGSLKSFLNDLGSVESVKFMGFMDSGLWGVDGDTYDVFHQNGVSRWHIAVDSKGIVTAANVGCGP
jgi:hypothetical protein